MAGELRGAFVFLSWLVCTSTAVALECPVSHAQNGVGFLKQPRTAIAESSRLLSQRGAQAIPIIIFRLRQEHPSSSNAEILNYFATAYCPVVEGNALLTESQKRERLTQFEREVWARLNDRLVSHFRY